MPQHVPDRRGSTQLEQLRAVPVQQRQADGYRHTLEEICQQPELWVATAAQIRGEMDHLRELVASAGRIVLTGSGSSFYVGESIAFGVQVEAGVPATALASGDLILFGASALPPERPLLVVSFARSGNSPESVALIGHLLETEPEIGHLVVTCNRTGRLAAEFGSYRGKPRMRMITLDDRTCDRSLVMTSSFTCMAVAGLGLAYAGRPDRYVESSRRLARLGSDLLGQWSDRLAALAVGGFQRLLVLGDGCGFGAARETALKMLEMTEGRVSTMAETTLGFRHGPMCALRDDAMLVMFLSSNLLRRAYQADLLAEVREKKLGARKIVVGNDVPHELLDTGDLAVDLPGLGEIPDDWASILQVVIGQLLAFFRCRAEDLRPDQPAAGGAISRVVTDFPLHGSLDKVRS